MVQVDVCVFLLLRWLFIALFDCLLDRYLVCYVLLDCMVNLLLFFGVLIVVMLFVVYVWFCLYECLEVNSRLHL